MRPRSPCHDCCDRTPTCHGVCLYYKRFARQMDAIRQHRAEEQEKQNTVTRYIIEHALRGKKRRKET